MEGFRGEPGGSADSRGACVCLCRASPPAPGPARGEVPAVRLPLDEQPADARGAPALHHPPVGHLPGERPSRPSLPPPSALGPLAVLDFAFEASSPLKCRLFKVHFRCSCHLTRRKTGKRTFYSFTCSWISSRCALWPGLRGACNSSETLSCMYRTHAQDSHLVCVLSHS